ncbi:hypothetical protein B0T16DRAFT_460495 [Cercophora newfieldiana]|uniref:NACHT domain-containing protein n=1 Tax=Cercophora newfieldiana TaxID=92897 RepID=A0AA40CMX7_9PEZI|nr:hypothetical protein B0T16DRAFT_460495 [Cercophora newfieldiana]
MSSSRAKTYRIRQLPCILAYPRQVASFLSSIVPDLAAEDVRVFSLAASLNPLEIPATKVATVMFNRVPPTFDTSDSEWVIPGRSAGLMRDVLVDVHFQGFTPLNDVPEEEHLMDCIAVSGLASHPFGSWKQRGASSFMWLRDRLPKEMPTVRSIIYGYDTALVGSESVKSIDDIAIAFISKMKSIGRSGPLAKPLILLAHSLGGIVLKQAIVSMSRAGGSAESILGSIDGLVFFGVPNRGMKVSHLLPMVEDQPNAPIVQLLSAGSDYLHSLDEQFSGIATHRSIQILSVYETKTSPTTQKTKSGQWQRGGPRALLVDKASGIQRNSIQTMPVDEDHSNLVKFGADDQDCQAIISFMNRVAEETSPTEPGPDELRRPGKKKGRSKSKHQGESEESVISKMTQSLNIDETGLRLAEVQTQYYSTFEWIFSDEDLGFRSWLESPQGLYWISGKPGSGKSTLMKFIRRDPRTHQGFTMGNPDAEHILIDFFFHDRGTSIQKSIEGLLYRSLYLILTARIEEGSLDRLVKLVLPLYSSRPDEKRSTWTIHQLRQSLEAILTQNAVPLHLLLFFDALDEFDGEAQIIADFVCDLSRPRPGSATLVKVCCSSRPWNAFRDSFSDVAGCKVHEHTKDDIQTYIRGRFRSNSRMLGMIESQQTDTRNVTQKLEDSLLDRAEGVFIWVRLVLDELLKECTDGAVPEELVASLSSFPDDLDDSYQRLINRIPPEYRFETYVLIETVLRSYDTLGLRDLGLVLLCASAKSPSEAAARLPFKPYSDEFLSGMRRRLQSRCGGLLEFLGDTKVQFMHQTAKEFFSRPGSTEAIVQHDGKLSRENGYSFLTKFWITLASAAPRHDEFDWPSYMLSLYSWDTHYIPQPHYLAAVHPLLPENNSMVHDRITAIALYGFGVTTAVERLLTYAYLAEVSTGRSQRRFLSRAEPKAFEAIPDFAPVVIRNHITSLRRVIYDEDRRFDTLHNFARAANLQVLLGEIEAPDRNKHQASNQEPLPTPGPRSERQSTYPGQMEPGLYSPSAAMPGKLT